LNDAPTLLSPSMVNVQVAAVPVHAPLHPTNCWFRPGVAVKVTDVPDEYVAVHVEPQLMPAGALDTVPLPLLLTLRAKDDPGGGVMVNMTLLETPPASGFVTVTLAVPGVAMSLPGMAAVSCEAFANVVVRAAPSQWTVDPGTNPLPLTVSVKAAPPAVALLGISAAIAGGTTVACP
jgi:hypothetical protein